MAIALSLLACENEAPALLAEEQEIIVVRAPEPPLDAREVKLEAHTSSGLPVHFSALSTEICEVHPTRGIVKALTDGTCRVRLEQEGNRRYAPARPVTQTIRFRSADKLEFAEDLVLWLDRAVMVKAEHSAGATVTYTSVTPQVCSVDPTTGLVVAMTLGTCAIAAKAGSLSALTSTEVIEHSAESAPQPPTGVVATSGGASDAVLVSADPTNGSGGHITSYTLSSVPEGLSTEGESLPLRVTCSPNCGGYAFRLSARNEYGLSAPSAPAHVVTRYTVTTTFFEPDTQPNNTIFVGEFSLDSTAGTLSELRGRLSQSMTGSSTPYPNDTMSWIDLRYQLDAKSIHVGDASGWLVTTFKLPTKNTLSDDSNFGGSDGFTPGTGMGLYYQYPGDNPGNAYVRIYVDHVEPLRPLVSAQIAWLAYADCTPAGMMGATCMTGTTVERYGTFGTMSGFPQSQSISQQ